MAKNRRLLQLERVSRWIVGLIFIYASIHKIIEPAAFAKIIYGYGLVPHTLINLMAITLPFIELVTGVMLLSGIWRLPAAWVAGAMLAVFILAISFNLIRGHSFDCGCFSYGASDTTLTNIIELIRDIVIFLLCVLSLRILYHFKRSGS